MTGYQHAILTEVAPLQSRSAVSRHCYVRNAVRAPELQNVLGRPALYQPFTRTFIYGSWDGRFTFYEPMVTRAYLLMRPDATAAAIPVPALYPEPGYYPTGYRVSYDAQAKEYLVALTGLTYHP